MEGVIYGFSILNTCHSRNTNLLSQLHLKLFCVRCQYSHYHENYMQKARYTSQLLIEMLCESGCWGSIWYFYRGKVRDYIFSKEFLVVIYVGIAIVYFPPHPPLFYHSEVTKTAYLMQEGGFLCNKLMNSTANTEIMPSFLYF
jgi:hypothetical protein